MLRATNGKPFFSTGIAPLQLSETDARRSSDGEVNANTFFGRTAYGCASYSEQELQPIKVAKSFSVKYRCFTAPDDAAQIEWTGIPVFGAPTAKASIFSASVLPSIPWISKA